MTVLESLLEKVPGSIIVKNIVHQKNGHLTRELLQNPGQFGLGQVPERMAPDATTTMACGYCSTGCGLKIHMKEGVAVSLSPTTNYPVNLGMACPKGWEALEVLKSDDRGTQPLLRGESGTLEPVDWDRALKKFCGVFKDIQSEYGKASVAFLSTGQIVNEEMAFLGALGKFGMGMVHGDGNTRQCMATAVTAYKQSFGFDAPPYTYQDFEESDALFFVGANPCIAHPIMWERVMRNKKSPEIIVVDPRVTETAMQSTLHLQIKPKSDLVLFYGLARILIHNDWLDHDMIATATNEFDGFAQHVESYSLDRVSEATGIAEQTLLKTADIIHERNASSFWWTMGVNQSYEGTRVAQSLINLALMTGNIGRPGTGANSITGQCNAMGSRIFSNTTNLLSGRNFTNEADRKSVSEILGIDVKKIPDENSWAYNEIIDGIEHGSIRGLWIIATNPAHSWINQNRWRRLREKLDFLVVQDMYHSTETATLADLYLPAAAWGEKNGTFINSERRIGLLKNVSPAPGQALADFSIFQLIAEYWGCGSMFSEWSSPEAVFQIMKKLTAGQPCDITGIDNYEMIDRMGGIQWPYPAGQNPEGNQRRLFEDRKFYFADERAKFKYEDPAKPLETTSAEYPFTLLTGRGSASQWHTQTRTGKSAVLRKLYPNSIFAEVHREDAIALKVKTGDKIRVTSRRGSIVVKTVVTSAVQQGHLFIPMHYETTNQLTQDSFDPYSKQPSYKACAVKVEAV